MGFSFEARRFVEKKRGEFTTRSGGEVNANTITKDPTSWSRMAPESVRVDLYYYLSMRPTKSRIWQRTFFKVGPVAGLKPTRVRQGQKYLRPRRHPLFGAPQAPGNKTTPYPPKGVKAWGYGPWGRRNSQVPRHTRQNRLEVKRPTECDPTGEERPHKHPKRASA